VHHWANLQSVQGFRCYDNIAPNAKCQRVLVLAPCLVYICVEEVDRPQQNTSMIQKSMLEYSLNKRINSRIE